MERGVLLTLVETRLQPRQQEPAEVARGEGLAFYDVWFRIPCFGFRFWGVSGFGFSFLIFRFRVSDFVLLVSGT